MKSPITGKEMKLRKEYRTMNFRKEEFKVLYHYYLCEDSKEQFTTTELDEVNMNQLYNQYRDRYNLPFPDEIKDIREKYGLSAVKMAEVLGFGVNVYRNYESGEVPSESNARLIQLAQDAEEFKKLVELSKVYQGADKEKMLARIDLIIKEEKSNLFNFKFEDYLLGNRLPDEYSGYRKPNLEKLAEMVVYFTEVMQPWKTKLNKLLFYADFAYFRQTCFSISGTRYRAIDIGPVPNNFSSIFEYLANNDDVDIYQNEFPNGSMGEQFKPNPHRKFNRELFDDGEFATLELIAKKFGKAKTEEIISISHKEKGWKENFEAGKKLISYSYGFELSTV